MEQTLMCPAETEVNYYKVCIEMRDADGDVYNSDMVYETCKRELAVQKAKELRDIYTTVVIETWDEENESLLDTTLENQY